MGFWSRQPTSNDQSRTNQNPWLGENEFMDEVALLLNGMAKRCTVCKRSTRLRHLDSNEHCPDCRKEVKP